MIRRALIVSAVLVGGAGAASAQSVTNITAAGLGYPIPVPVASQTPVTGFRTAASLRARFLDLALSHGFITEIQTGLSLNAAPIYSYKFERGGTTTPEGIPKSAAMIQGTIHAREWISPEVVANVFEWLAQNDQTDPVANYLLSTTTIILHPVGNPDGFAVTQAYPSQTVSGNSSGITGSDGRMRRKNLRNADATLTTTTDYRNGVDLNRNHQFGFANSSSSQTQETYHGTSAGSEPESSALYGAAGLLDPDRLRFYCDVHSFDQSYYLIFDSSASRTTAVTDAYTLMKNASLAMGGRTYARHDVDLATGATGATDEYFAGTFACMSYTLEVRPTGFEVSNGFILAASQVPAARDETLAALTTALYYAAGPAALLKINIFDTTAGRAEDSPVVYTGSRSYNVVALARAQVSTQQDNLKANHTYTAVLQFNKPMRLKSTIDSSPIFLPGATGSTNASVALVGLANATNPSWNFTAAGGNFGYTAFPGDTLLVDFILGPSVAASGAYVLSVGAVDAAGKSIDGDPRTVADWSRQGWVNWEGASSTVSDTLSSIQFEAAPPVDTGKKGWITY